MKKIYLYLLIILANFTYGSKNEIILSFEGNPDKFDYQFSDGITEYNLSEFLMEGLTKQGEDGNPVPGIAEKWDVSQDGLVWTFHLRDAKWENGEPVTADDFKFSWLRVLENSDPHYQWLLHPIKGAVRLNHGEGKRENIGIRVIDSKTLEVTLENPTEYFDSLLSQSVVTPLNEKFYNIHKEKYGMNIENIMSNGPYKLTKWTNEGNLELVKNENYWNKESIGIDKIKVKLLDRSLILPSYEKGELDIAIVNYGDYLKVKGNKNLKFYEDGAIWYLEYNLENNFLVNKKIRQAFTMIIDKNELSEILGDRIIPAYGFVPSYIKGKNKTFREEAGDTFPYYNSNKARELFSEGLEELGLQEAPKITMTYNNIGYGKEIMEYIQGKLKKELNYEIEIESVLFRDRIIKMMEKDFDVVLAGWSADYTDALSYMDLWETDGVNNHTSYTNKKYDDLINTARKSSNREERIEAMIKAERILGEDVPISVIFYKQRMVLINPKLKEVILKSFGNEYYLNKAYIK